MGNKEAVGFSKGEECAGERFLSLVCSAAFFFFFPIQLKSDNVAELFCKSLVEFSAQDKKSSLRLYTAFFGGDFVLLFQAFYKQT